MDANYVMDETLGNASYDISKLSIGQKKMESFLIGKVRYGENSSRIKLYMTFKNKGEGSRLCICTLRKYQAFYLHVASNDILYLPNRQPKSI